MNTSIFILIFLVAVCSAARVASFSSRKATAEPYSISWGNELRVRSFGVIRIRISDPRSLGSWYIKEADESVTRVDSSASLMYHDPCDLGSLIRIRITPKERILSLWVTNSNVENSAGSEAGVIRLRNAGSADAPTEKLTSMLKVALPLWRKNREKLVKMFDETLWHRKESNAKQSPTLPRRHNRLGKMSLLHSARTA